MSDLEVPSAALPAKNDGEDYRLERQIGFLLRRAHQVASDVFQAQIGARNLTPQQFSVLVTLLRNRELGQTKLGEIVGLSGRATQRSEIAPNAGLVLAHQLLRVVTFPDIGFRRRLHVPLG